MKTGIEKIISYYVSSGEQTIKTQGICEERGCGTGSLATLSFHEMVNWIKANAFSTIGVMGDEETMYTLDKGIKYHSRDKTGNPDNPRAAFLIETHVDAFYPAGIPMIEATGSLNLERMI